MAGLLGEQALELAFDKLVNAVVDACRRVVAFRSDLENLKLILFQIKPIIKDIDKLDELIRTRPDETRMLTNMLEDGEALIQECLKIKRHNLCKKWRYSKKLGKFEKSLLKLFQIHIPIQSSRDLKRTLLQINEVAECIRNIDLNTSQGIGNGNSILPFVGVTAIGLPNPNRSADLPAVPCCVVGFDMALQELKKMLLRVNDDDDDDPVLVISAPGGCGKTTLAQMICHDQDIQTKYKKIPYVTVSRTPNLRVIAHKIFNKLSNGLVPDFRSDEDAISQLALLLQGPLVSDSMLLVLDDVWDESCPIFGELSVCRPKCKVLVTTRCEFPLFKHMYKYKLQLLPDNDAKTLFCNWAFGNGEPNVRSDLVDKAVKSCGGIPLALKVVGRSLYGEHEFNWIKTIERQTKGQILCSSGINLLDCLQSSIDALDRTSKDCYLDLGLFLEDQRLPPTVLLDIWKELYNFYEDHAFFYLHKLADRNLIDLAYRRKHAPACIGLSNVLHHVTQHDVLRELAIHQNAHEAIENRGRLYIGNDFNSKQTSLQLQAQMLSISTDEAFFSNGYELQVPNLEVLLLNFKTMETSPYTLPNFVEKASHLKVLVLTNNRLSPAKFSNSTLLCHLHKLKCIRLERIYFSSICESVFKLANLQKLSLVMCEVGRSFQDCVFRMPKLVEINIEYCDDLVELPIEICNLEHLETLNISYCQDLVNIPEELGNLENLKFLRLHSCSNLRELPDSIGKLCKLRSLDIYDCVDLDSIPLQIGELRSLEIIFMGGHQGVAELPDSVVKLEQLKYVICDEETSLSWEYYKPPLKAEITTVKDDMNLDWLHKSSCLGNLYSGQR